MCIWILIITHRYEAERFCSLLAAQGVHCITSFWGNCVFPLLYAGLQATTNFIITANNIEDDGPFLIGQPLQVQQVNLHAEWEYYLTQMLESYLCWQPVIH